MENASTRHRGCWCCSRAMRAPKSSVLDWRAEPRVPHLAVAPVIPDTPRCRSERGRRLGAPIGARACSTIRVRRPSFSGPDARDYYAVSTRTTAVLCCSETAPTGAGRRARTTSAPATTSAAASPATCRRARSSRRRRRLRSTRSRTRSRRRAAPIMRIRTTRCGSRRWRIDRGSGR